MIFLRSKLLSLYLAAALKTIETTLFNFTTVKRCRDAASLAGSLI